MKTRKFLRNLCLVTVVLVMLASCALADTIIFDGTVKTSKTEEVYAPIGGTISKVNVSIGDTVHTGDVVASYKTNKVYAEADGTVTGIFGQPGDNAETVAKRYGAVLYIEDTAKYTVSASTSNAYSSTETKFVHVGEQVYMKSRTDSTHTAIGVITSASGVDYTVEVRSGEVMSQESVEIYRTSTYTNSSRLGRGTVSRISPTAVSGSGSIVSFAVADGDSVKRGDLLFETLDGTFDGLYMSGTDIYAPVDGVVGAVNLNVGQSVQKDSLVLQIYPLNAMYISGEVPEDDLSSIKAGDKVSIEMNWNEDAGVTYDGTVRSISAIATQSQGAESSTVTFTALIDFTPDSDTRYGMSAVISTLE